MELLPEYHVHANLKCCKCISQAKGHAYEFKMALMTTKSCFLYVFFSHPDLMISITKANHREKYGPMYLIH